MNTLVAFASLALALVAVPEAEAGFRCGFLGFLGNDRACRYSCWATGHTTGRCDIESECLCSEVELDLSKALEEALKTKSIEEYVKEKIQEFQDEIASWELSEKVKSLIPSRCQVGDGFCKASCQTIGKVNGECNEDKTDCTCAERSVTPKQWAMCLDEAVCTVLCQSKGRARGRCDGPDQWDCKCISYKDSGEGGDGVVDIDDIQEQSPTTETSTE